MATWNAARKTLANVETITRKVADRLDLSKVVGTLELMAFTLTTTKGGKINLQTYVKGGASISVYIDDPLDDLIAILQSGVTFKLADLESGEYEGRRSNEGQTMTRYVDRWEGGNLRITGFPETHKVTSVKVAAIA